MPEHLTRSDGQRTPRSGSFRAKRRISAWLRELRRWALPKIHGSSGIDESQYACGVIIAVDVSTRRRPPLLDGGKSLPLLIFTGYCDAVELIHKVLTYGDAPKGDFEELLGMPYGDPL